MKKLIAFLLLLLFIILAYFSWNWYKKTVVCCDTPNQTGEVASTKIIKYRPLIFTLNNHGVNNTSFHNLDLAKVHAFKQLSLSSINLETIGLGSKFVNYYYKDNIISNLYSVTRH